MNNTLRQSFHKLFSDASHSVLLHLTSLSSLLQANINVLLEGAIINSVDHIAEPLSINMDPVFQVWHMHFDSLILFSILEELLHGKTFNHWHSGHLHCISSHVLQLKLALLFGTAEMEIL